MSAEAAFLVRAWRVGRRTATLTVPHPRPGALLSAVIEWTPDQPGRLSKAEMAEHRAGRDRAIAEIAHALGVTAAVLEV